MAAVNGRRRGRGPSDNGGGALHPFLQQIRARQAAVSPIQRRILDFLLDHQEEAVFLTTTALATRLDVSEASVVRLCRTLGFGGFREFQSAFRQYARQPISRVSRVGNRLSVYEIMPTVRPTSVLIRHSYSAPPSSSMRL